MTHNRSRALRVLAMMVLAAMVVFVVSCASPPPPTPTPVPTQPPAPTQAPAATAAAKPTTAPTTQISSQTSGKPKDLVKIYQLGGIIEAPYYIGIEQGYFAEQNIQAELVPFTSGVDAFAPMARGDLDVFEGALTPALTNGIIRGLPIRIVGGNAEQFPANSSVHLVGRMDLKDQVKDYKDLKGRKIAITSLQSSAEFSISKALALGGLTLKDVELVPLGPADMVAALQNKAVDFAYLNEPNVSNVVAKGIGFRWKAQGDWDPGMMAAYLVFSAKLTDNKDLAVRFWKAYLKGVRTYYDGMIKNDPVKRKMTIDALVKYSSVKDPAVYDKIAIPMLPPNGELNVQWTRDALTYLKQYGFEVPPEDKMYDFSARDQAVKEMGEYKWQ